MQTVNIHIDGAARGNPGPAAFAYVISRDGWPSVEHADCLGSATNNVAEYTALVRALERAAHLGVQRLHIRSDSELLVKQMNGEYKVKNASLRELYDQAQEFVGRFESVTIQHVRREQNKRADQLCNDALDGRLVLEMDVALPAVTQEGAGCSISASPREELLAILHKAAKAWGRGKAKEPSPEEVCEEVWQLLLARGVLGPSQED